MGERGKARMGEPDYRLSRERAIEAARSEQPIRSDATARAIIYLADVILHCFERDEVGIALDKQVTQVKWPGEER
jgi:hypothetical protein